MLKPYRPHRWGMVFAMIGFAMSTGVLETRRWGAKCSLAAAMVDLLRHLTSPMGMAFFIGGLMVVVGAYYYLFTPVFYVLDDSEPTGQPARPARPPASVPPGHTLH